MGMYTEFQFSAELDYDKHEEIIDVLRFMTGDETVEESDLILPVHPLFDTDRWGFMLRSASYYFASNDNYCNLVEEHKYNLVGLNVLCSLKNYDEEIEKFCNWIQPYIDYSNSSRDKSGQDARVFVGHKRYENDIDPSFIYFTPDEVLFVKPSFE